MEGYAGYDGEAISSPILTITQTPSYVYPQFQDVPFEANAYGQGEAIVNYEEGWVPPPWTEYEYGHRFQPMMNYEVPPTIAQTPSYVYSQFQDVPFEANAYGQGEAVVNYPQVVPAEEEGWVPPPWTADEYGHRFQPMMMNYEVPPMASGYYPQHQSTFFPNVNAPEFLPRRPQNQLRIFGTIVSRNAPTRIPQLRPRCALCLSNRETPEVYNSHRIKDRDGNVVCPVLRKLICRICGATGDKAHTLQYCPMNKTPLPFVPYC